MNMTNTMNVNSVRRPRRLPGTRTVPSRAQLAAPVNRGNQRGRGIPRGRCLDGRDKQVSRPGPGLQDKKLATIAGKQREA